MAEGNGLLNRYTVLNPYRGFESLPLRRSEVSEERASKLLCSRGGFEGRESAQRPGYESERIGIPPSPKE